MNSLVFSIVVYSFVSLSVLTTLFFLGMMFIDDITTKPHNYKDHTK